jgi:hypothetical protein
VIIEMPKAHNKFKHYAGENHVLLNFPLHYLNPEQQAVIQEENDTRQFLPEVFQLTRYRRVL